MLGQLIHGVHGGLANDGFPEIRTGHVEAAAGGNAAREHRRAKTLAGALRFPARFSAAHHFAGLCIHNAIVEHNHRLGIRLRSADYAPRARNERAHAAAHFAVIAAEHDDITHKG